VPHFEIVELHVRPSRQRSGIGSRLLAQLLSRQPHDRAVLSTQTGSRKARRFYAKNGWIELAGVDFGAGYPPYLVLGKRL
jgi:GNAT superfamily N-acetyltransferase